ncbi:MAG: cation transporting ATPase C-terminal domain-containing protein [Cyanobacteriota bacterium]|nr:cation transporting ATPase C-terminal domain-containing protein [Cyanobacteriota bacterium]
MKVLTGDNPVIARKTCRDVGLAVEGVLLGPEVEAMDDDTLAQRVDATTIFAKLSPLKKKKARILRLLRRQGHVVGFLGDGINDAAALREADLGISVDTAVDIAKGSADIVLLEKNLLVLHAGNTPERQSLVQTGWFVESLLTQTSIVYIIRTSHIPFLQSNPAPLMALITLAVMAIGLSLPFTPLAPGFGLVPLPATTFGWLALILLAYAVHAQLVKGWFLRRYGDD